jgi:manganese/zinc/iron transport system ATP- binding protein
MTDHAIQSPAADALNDAPKAVRDEAVSIENAADCPLLVRDLTVAYHRKPVLWDVEVKLPEGGLVGVIGPNGAGKSTLIKAVLGIVPCVSGEVLVYGRSYRRQRHLVGYVPQRESVDWDFPVDALDVVIMGRYGRLGWFRRPRRADRAAAMDCLDRVGMADFARRQISQLSGGQQQRVFLARALAQEARLYFMDEPFAGVDAATETAIVELLRQLRADGRTCMIVHHDLPSAREYFDHVILLNMRVVAQGPTETTLTTTNLQRTYGGRLDLLDEAAVAVARAKGM